MLGRCSAGEEDQRVAAHCGGGPVAVAAADEDDRVRRLPERGATGERDDAQAAGLSLAEIRSVLALRDSGQAPCARVGALIDQHLAEVDRRMAELREAQTELRKLAGRAAVTDPDSCSEGEICTILSRS
ncbi:MerR family DNA-binding protein [Streptomyces sp. NPDC054961]